jgi:N-acyl-D-amino-acid deacylase
VASAPAPRAARAWALLATAVTLAASCADSTPSDPPAGGGSLVVQAPASTLLTGDTLQLTVRTLSGDPVPASQVSWSSEDVEVARVSADGRLVGSGPGQVRVSATRSVEGDEERGEASFTVWFGRGRRVPGMASYDRLVPELMSTWGIEGGAVAVVKDGRLVYARSYGWADLDAGEPVEPASLFRIASVSKPITAAAVLLLVERGLLDLDQPAFALFDDLEPPDGATVDPRLASVTIRHLLEHSGGWDRDQAFDPMFRPDVAAAAVGAPAPADAETVIRYMLGHPLQFDPGGRYAYSNFGYAVLGRVIERVSGTPYETFVRAEVLGPLGVERMAVGHSRLAGRMPGEVRYYDGATAASVFPGGGQVPVAYGGFHLEAMDAHGGWVASTVDLLRFTTGVDGRPEPPDLLAPASVALMIAPPPPPLWVGSAYHYGLGWLVRPTGGDANWWHGGSLPGTSTLLVRSYHGVAWAALFNRRASNASGSFADALDALLWDALAGVTAWPEHDLFGELP